MKRVKFQKINDYIYYLNTPNGDSHVGIILVRGNENTIIDTGANDSAIADYLIPALRYEKIPLKDLHTVTITHAHPDNIGGLSTIVREFPHIKVKIPHGLVESVRNPMNNIIKERSLYPFHNPPFQEIRGVYATSELSLNEKSGETNEDLYIKDLTPVYVSGHADGVCWYHQQTETLICGDALQGNGNTIQGLPFYTSIEDYRSSLKKIEGLSVNYMVTSHDMEGFSCIEEGLENFRNAIRNCRKYVTLLSESIKKYITNGITDPETIAREISIEHFDHAPGALTYAIQTVQTHITEEGLLKSTKQ